VDVYGLVFHIGYWYAVGYCHLRQDLRTFRLDRVLQVKLLETTFSPPPDFDALAFLWGTIARIPSTWHSVILLKMTMQEAKERVPPDLGLMEEVEDGVVLRCYSEGLEWLARFLVGLRCPVTVIQPPQLRKELRKLSRFIAQMAKAPKDEVMRDEL
jgi:predicted DNA-binding transcriptional regulator YafY